MTKTKKRIISSLLALIMITTLSGMALTAPEIDVHSELELDVYSEFEMDIYPEPEADVYSESEMDVHPQYAIDVYSMPAISIVEETSSAPCCYDCALGRRHDEYSIDEILEYINNGGSIYENLRVYTETAGVMTYRVPMTDGVIEDLVNLQYSNIQPLNANPFKTERIMYSGLPHADSIVVILLSDGFAENEYDIVFNHAESVMESMLDTHPFGLFSHLFTVYVIHTHGTNDATGIGYLATIRETQSGTTVNQNSVIFREYRRPRVWELANSIVPPHYQDMIQIFSNAGGTGWAWMAINYNNWVGNPNIAVTATNPDSYPPGGGGYEAGWAWPAGKLWHGVILHEFGHSFGMLKDEHEWEPGGEFYANSTMMPNGELKWSHWVGYRSVEPPVPLDNGWIVPVRFASRYLGEDGCIMFTSSLNRNFCGVCSAELIRRMALISGEIFHGRSPWTEPPYHFSNNYPRVRTPVMRIAEGTTRILDSAFHGNASIETVHIPQSVEDIGDFAFIGTTSLRTIHSPSAVPQQINETTFAGVDRTLVTVWIPIGTTQAYRDAGWVDFILKEVEGGPDLTITFHAYGEGMFIAEDAYGNRKTSFAVPVVFDEEIHLIDIQAYLEYVDYNENLAFWGWFTDSDLDNSGRIIEETGRRRPTVGETGFTELCFITYYTGMPDKISFTEAEWEALVVDGKVVDGNLDLYAIWSLWGDVNDDGQVNSDDLRELTWYVGQLSPRPTLNLGPADVHRNGVVNSDDLRELTWYVGQLSPRPVLGQRAESPSASPEAINSNEIADVIDSDYIAKDDTTVYDIPEYAHDDTYEDVTDDYVDEEDDYTEFYALYASIDSIIDDVIDNTGVTESLLTNEIADVTESGEAIIHEAAAAAATTSVVGQKLPQTGVEGTVLLWASLMTLSLMLAIGAVAEIKKRKDSKDI